MMRFCFLSFALFASTRLATAFLPHLAKRQSFPSLRVEPSQQEPANAIYALTPLVNEPNKVDQPVIQEANGENEAISEIQDEVIVKEATEETEEDQDDDDGEQEESEPSPEQLYDEKNMRLAIDLALELGGELGESSAYPNPTTGAVLVTEDGTILGKGRSDYKMESVQAALMDSGLDVTPLNEWCVSWPSSASLRQEIAKATLYLTLEPSHQRRGQATPPITQLIELSGVRRVVIGCPDPIPERSSKGASMLHSSGIDVTMGSVLADECQDMISLYAERANGKLQRMARKHYQQFKRPLGFLHCSVVDSDDVEAFANSGNAFGSHINGNSLNYRDFGSYEIAPPPEVIWADNQEDDDDEFEDEDIGDIFALEFDEEDEQERLGGTPMMPWYEQVDAVVATFPRPGNGPHDDDSVNARLNGLKWLATYGNKLPVGVERVLTMDATDLDDLPLTNDDPNLPKGVDIENFWKAEGRKPTRVLLRRGNSAQAQAAAKAAAEAAASAAKAAQAATEAIETGDAESAAEAAIECQQAAVAATELAQKELMAALKLKRRLENLGVVVETLSGGEPVDVMNHLGQRNGYTSVVWRAGCWGNRGVKSILDGAFQWVSAHLAVDAVGGKFWQLMLAERAIQGACGPESKVKVFAEDDNLSLEYCDEPEADSDCALTVDGKPVRHVRLDCRVALVDPERQREFVTAKTKVLDQKHLEEEAPWFL